MWQQWLNFVVGLWVIASSYMGFTTDAMITNFTVSGIVVAGLALWGALEHRRMMSRGGEYSQRHA